MKGRILIGLSLLFLVSGGLSGCNISLAEEEAALLSAPAEIVKRGIVNGFEEGLNTSDGKLVYCETSATVYDGTNIILASDKPIPCDNCSSVFSIGYRYIDEGLFAEPVHYLTAPPLVNAVKYEDMTITPDGRYIIATTGFDRVKPGSAEWDSYNTLLIWPVGKPGSVKVVSPTTADGVTSSVSLRGNISRALETDQFPEGVPYFKVEGLAAIPGNELIFGIRELGASYKDFDYAVKMVSISYDITDDELVLGDDFELIYDYDPETNAKIDQTIALSGLEYDKYGDCLYMLTSFEESETDEGLGGYLWILPLEDLIDGGAPTLVLKEDGDPLLFAHKSEGVTVINESCVLVVHDDDRVLGREVVDNPETQFSRKANQGAYTVVDFLFWCPSSK